MPSSWSVCAKNGQKLSCGCDVMCLNNLFLVDLRNSSAPKFERDFSIDMLTALQEFSSRSIIDWQDKSVGYWSKECR